jgi:protein-tyrosine-phosphatase
MEAEIKLLEKQHAQLEREMKSVTVAYSECRKKFLDAASKHRDLKESDKSFSDPKVAAKLAEKEREVKRRELELKAATETLNETRDITNGQSLPSLLKAVYCVEEMRIQTMRQGINQLGCLVRNQKIPYKQIGEQILAASHNMKALEDLKQYQEAVATNLPAPSDELIETYDPQTCKINAVEMDEQERAVAIPKEISTSRDDPSLLKGLKSMFSGLSRKKSDTAHERHAASAGAADSPSAVAQRRASKIMTKRFYGLSIENHLTRKFRGYPVPLIAATLMDFVLTMDGPKTQGIFRLSAPVGEMAVARNQIEVHVA